MIQISKALTFFFDLNRNINGDFAKFEAEEILAASPEYKKDLKHVKFSRNYFLDFFELLFIMAGATSFLQVSYINLNNYNQ